MIDMIIIGGIQGFRHNRRPGGGKAEEDRFYAEFGDNSIRFAAWLTSLNLNLRLRRKAAAQSGGSCGRVPQATFLAAR
ncbi:hypothetical protein RHEC894_CH00740 [Rhizobium sp. CIAT894]|uniref:hypothetical protein n=1 Tax=Rhizobium sp. CIAT894 TaxID=2020312 RepID=UPI0001908637|nr:hypothetical protein [Rhizobium sp. CIAT894]ARM87083.1 hypothetical protein RHEC894_CH00740 [Rhizobium sp. CIAT894]